MNSCPLCEHLTKRIELAKKKSEKAEAERLAKELSIHQLFCYVAYVKVSSPSDEKQVSA